MTGKEGFPIFPKLGTLNAVSADLRAEAGRAALKWLTRLGHVVQRVVRQLLRRR